MFAPGPAVPAGSLLSPCGFERNLLPRNPAVMQGRGKLHCDRCRSCRSRERSHRSLRRRAIPTTLQSRSAMSQPLFVSGHTKGNT